MDNGLEQHPPLPLWPALSDPASPTPHPRLSTPRLSVKVQLAQWQSQYVIRTDGSCIKDPHIVYKLESVINLHSEGANTHTHTHRAIRRNRFCVNLYDILSPPQRHHRHTTTHIHRLIYCSHIPMLEADDNCGRPINYCCLHINYKHHVWQWGKWDLVTNFTRVGCPAAFLNMLQIAIPYLASVMGSYGWRDGAAAI